MVRVRSIVRRAGGLWLSAWLVFAVLGCKDKKDALQRQMIELSRIQPKECEVYSSSLFSEPFAFREGGRDVVTFLQLRKLERHLRLAPLSGKSTEIPAVVKRRLPHTWGPPQKSWSRQCLVWFRVDANTRAMKKVILWRFLGELQWDTFDHRWVWLKYFRDGMRLASMDAKRGVWGLAPRQVQKRHPFLMRQLHRSGSAYGARGSSDIVLPLKDGTFFRLSPMSGRGEKVDAHPPKSGAVGKRRFCKHERKAEKTVNAGRGSRPAGDWPGRPGSRVGWSGKGKRRKLKMLSSAADATLADVVFLDGRFVYDHCSRLLGHGKERILIVHHVKERGGPSYLSAVNPGGAIRWTRSMQPFLGNRGLRRAVKQRFVMGRTLVLFFFDFSREPLQTVGIDLLTGVLRWHYRINKQVRRTRRK